MSKLTTCNYCTWKYRKRRAKECGEQIRLGPSKKIPGWTAMIKTDKKTGKEKEIGWFIAITDSCVC